jgi:cytochrome c biogenesis protein CcmG/thiol:disulfide interchange protein DsbE
MKHADIARGATKRRRPGTLFAAAGLVLLLVILPALIGTVHAQNGSKSLHETLIPASQRKSAPGFTLLDAQGKSVSLEGYRGKVVLLDFWATWCGGCKVEIPWYIDFDRQYRDHGLAAVGASMDEDGWKSVRPFLARKVDPETGGDIAMPYPVVIATPAMAKQYNITSMPVTFLIDRQGRIALSHIGVVDRRSFENEIQELLKEPAGFSSLN